MQFRPILPTSPLKFVFGKADMALGWQEPLPRSLSDREIFKERLMSTSAVSGSSINQQLQQYFQTRQSDLQQLGQALQSGDLAGAQTAYNSITALGQTGPFASGNPFWKTNRETDFTAVGQALQSGDLAGAQQAFTTLEGTFRREVGAQNSPSASPAAATSAASSGPEIVLNLSSNSGTTNPEQITINISNPASGGGEQVSLSVGAQGSNAQQVTFNLNPNSNEQIVVNLLGESSSASSGSSSSGGGLSVSA
jgi:hypothetical protein